jgi:hypothetical protein
MTWLHPPPVRDPPHAHHLLVCKPRLSHRSLLKESRLSRFAWSEITGAGHKRLFSNEMNFPNPDGCGPALTCFWHGEIKKSQYRIYFEWPIPAPSKRLRVGYIGPKTAKRRVTVDRDPIYAEMVVCLPDKFQGGC